MKKIILPLYFIKRARFFSAVLIFSLLVNLSTAQNIAKLDCAEMVIPESIQHNNTSRPYVVYIFSSPGCGYSVKLKSDIAKQPVSDKIKAVFMEHDATIEKIKGNLEGYAGHEVRTVTTCPKWFTLYFPITILVNAQTGKKMARYKGYYPDLWQKIEKKLN